VSDIQDEQDAYFAYRRPIGRIAVSRRFPFAGEEGLKQLAGTASRFAYTVFESDIDSEFSSEDGWELVLRETPTRQQLKVLFFEDSRKVIQIAFQRFRDRRQIARESFTLRGDEAAQLIAFFDLLRSKELILSEDGERIKFTRELAGQVLADGSEIFHYARAHPEVLKSIIESEITAPDVIALARRRKVLDEFDSLLHDREAFEAAASAAGGPEKAWQQFMERNPWVIGGTLAPQFLHSFDPERLEQVVRGYSLSSGGRRADAVLRTAGVISTLVIAEIKHHETALVMNQPYRSNYWAVGSEVVGGVAQCQSTVDAAQEQFSSSVELTDSDGVAIDDISVCRPRSLLGVGSLSQFIVGGRLNRAKFESFERFRRSLRDPEIVTFDELFERARVMLKMAEIPLHIRDELEVQ
jgi:hypothetical protein